MERRGSTRIPFRASAFLIEGGRRIGGETVDISRHGIFVSTAAPHKRGDRTLVSILLRSGRTRISVTLPCAVARVSRSGIGCTSTHLEPETLLFLSNLIHSRSLPPREVIPSFYRYLEGVDVTFDN